MNILFFLKPKSEVAYLYDDFSVRQALERMEYHRYTSIPVINRKGEYVGSITEGDLLWGASTGVPCQRCLPTPTRTHTGFLTGS